MVAPWLGESAVWPIKRCTWLTDIFNSSATTWAKAVRSPVPMSTWPCKAVTLASSHKANTHSSPSLGRLATKLGCPATGAGCAKGERKTSNTPRALKKSLRWRTHLARIRQALG